MAEVGSPSRKEERVHPLGPSELDVACCQPAQPWATSYGEAAAEGTAFITAQGLALISGECIYG